MSEAINLSAPKAGRPSSTSQEERHARLIEIAADEFLENGFEATSIDGIARVAGVAKHTIYRNFGSKEGLLRASLLSRYGVFKLQLQNLLNEAGEPAQVLLEVARHITLTYTRPRSLALTRLVIAQMGKVAELDDVIEHMNEMVRSPLLAYFATLHERGVLLIPNVQISTVQFINLCTLGPYFLLDGNPDPVQQGQLGDEIAHNAVRMFIAGHQPA